MRKGDPPVVVEQTFARPIEVLWKAITDIDQMRRWYFDNIPDFKPEVGFETQFNIVSGERKFLHLWKVTEVVPFRKIVYDWQFEGYAGDSYTIFELSEHGQSTKLTLSCHVRESFDQNIPEFKRESCEAGWNYFIRKSLKEFLDGAE